MRTSHGPFRSIAAIATAGALTLGACGGDDESAGEPADQPAEEPADQPADQPAAERATITIADFAFDGVTEVAVGTTVVVTNSDNASHTWTALDDTFDSGALGEGDTFEFTFTEPGEFAYQCNFHPSMTGTIVVTAS